MKFSPLKQCDFGGNANFCQEFSTFVSHHITLPIPEAGLQGSADSASAPGAMLSRLRMWSSESDGAVKLVMVFAGVWWGMSGPMKALRPGASQLSNPTFESPFRSYILAFNASVFLGWSHYPQLPSLCQLRWPQPGSRGVQLLNSWVTCGC